MRPWQSRSSRLFPGAVGAEDDGARAGRQLDIDVRDPHLAARGIAHAFQAERQDGAVAVLAGAGHGWRPARSRMTKAAPFTPSDSDDQDDAEAQRQRQIALRGLQRDRRRHHPRHMIDIAADDHDRADLGARPAEAGEERGHEAEAAVPEQGQDRAARTAAQRLQLLAIFGPEILHQLAGEGGDDRA